MSILNTLFARRKKSQYLPSRIWDAMVIGKGSWISSTQPNKREMIEQAYQRNAPFYAACNIIARTIADMPVEVEYSNAGKKGLTQSHPLLQLMERNCTREEFIERFVLYYLVTGEAFAEIVWSGEDRKRPLGLINLPSQYTHPIQGDRYTPIQGYKYVEHKTVELDKRDVIHLYRPSLSNYFDALSPTVPLQEVISLQNAALTWNKNIAQKGGLPPIFASAEGIDKAEAEAIKDEWERQSGADNSHRLKIAGGDVKFHKLDVTPHDSEWNNAILLAMRMIFMTMGVSSSLMNDAANKTYNNVHDSRKALYTEASIPIAKRIYGAITNALQNCYKDEPIIRIPTDKIASIQEDTKDLMQYLVDAVDAGIMTANEARKKLGLPKATGATADTLQNARIINNIPKVDLNG